MLSKESWPPSLPGGKGGGGKRAGEEGLGKDNCKNPLSEDRLLLRSTEGMKKGQACGNRSLWVFTGGQGSVYQATV